MSLRVISGTAKGRRLKTVPGDITRPVMDRVKEALFDVLAGDVIDSTWWDLFGGTGAIGIEALSRGAAFVRFTDVNRAPVETIRANLDHCGFSGRAEVRRGDAFTMLGAPADRPFDYMYIAPPQYMDLWSRALRAVDAQADWITPWGTLIVQIDRKEYVRVELAHFDETEQRKYGNTLLVFYDPKT